MLSRSRRRQSKRNFNTNSTIVDTLEDRRLLSADYGHDLDDDRYEESDHDEFENGSDDGSAHESAEEGNEAHHNLANDSDDGVRQDSGVDDLQDREGSHDNHTTDEIEVEGANHTAVTRSVSETDESDQDDSDRDHDEDQDGVRDDFDDNGTDFRGTLSGVGTASGSIEFESELEHGSIQREFEVEVRGLQPGSSHAVSVNGIEVGTVTVGSRGYGRLKLSDRPERNEQHVPSNFPAITDGTVIAVGNELTGSMSNINPAIQANESLGDGGGDHLRVNLTSTGTSQGRVSFESSGDARQGEFRAEVWNATPGEQLPVVLSNVQIGSILVNSRGYGRIQFEDGDDGTGFPTNWPGVVDGTRIEIGSEQSGIFSGRGRLADASPSEYLEAYDLDQRLQLRAAENMFENWGGLGEKWLYGEGGWYFIIPDGGLYRWDGTPGATGSLIGTLDTSFFDNPQLLYSADASHISTIDDDVARLTAADLDHDLDLHFDGDYYENWGGEGEKWVKGSDGWYFILPDGSLYRWTRGSGVNGELIAGLDSRFHADPTLLTEALQSLSVDEAAYAIDHGLNLYTTPSDFFNWGGRNEKWLKGDGGWYFIVEDGGFYSWDGKPTASGSLITTLSPDYYNNLSFLASTPSSGRNDIEDMLDDIFTDISSLLTV